MSTQITNLKTGTTIAHESKGESLKTSFNAKSKTFKDTLRRKQQWVNINELALIL